jgi:hypothetical protein
MTSKLGSNALAKKWRSGFGLGCLGGAVVTVVILAALGVAVRRAPEGYPGPVRSFYGARGGVVDGADGGSALSIEQIRAIRGVQPTIAVTLTEDDINTYVRENPNSIGLPKEFKDPRVKFADGRVRLLISTKVFLFSTRITISMVPRVEDATLKLTVKKIEAGSVDLPGELRQIAEQRVADLLAERLGTAGLRPESVEVADGRLTVAARLVPVDAPPDEPEPQPEEPGASPPEEPAGAEQVAPASKDDPAPDPADDPSGEGAPQDRPWWPGN